MLRAVVFLGLAVASTPAALAWGDDGHKIVCEIATGLLTPGEQKEVKALVRALARPDGQRYASLATACTFADRARFKARAHAEAVRHGRTAEAKKLEGWARFEKLDRRHFVNVLRRARDTSEGDCAKGCVLEAIATDRRSLSDRSLPPAARAEALAFLGHWVADAHQPLHVAYADDRGGNTIDRLTGLYAEAENLHAVWDGGILSRARGARHWRTYAGVLAAGIDAGERKRWERAADAHAWADESYAIATQEAMRYCRWEDDLCRSLGPQRALDASYQARFQPVVETRLQQAAVRLAKTISAALKGSP
jgi:hypothetical protein